MIALDIGGTKTSLFFSEKEKLSLFEERYASFITEINKKQKYCVIPTRIFQESEEKYNEFFSYLKSMDSEIISTFPGIVKIEKEAGEWKFRLFSRRFPFLIGKYVDLNFAVNDLYAFAYYHARRFFKDPDNRDKTILAIQIGTGVNAVHMNYYDYKELLFLWKIFEAGHITMRQDAEQCYCGRKGCAELYVSGKFLEKLGNGDPTAVFRDEALKREYYTNLSLYISSLVILFSPNKIVFGGGVAKSLDTALLHKLMEENFPHFKIHLNIEYEKDQSRLSNLRGIVALYEKFKKKFAQKSD
jgi:hypothetical protein